MKRINVIAIPLCGLGLVACTGSDLSSFDAFTPKPTTTVLTIESTPPGAEARTSLGANCRTPCKLPIASPDDFTVSYALDGYQPQTVTVHSSLPSTGFSATALPSGMFPPSFSASAPVFDPNPVIATLQPVPPATPPPNKRPVR